MVVKNVYELEFKPSSEAEGGASVPFTRVFGEEEFATDLRWLDLCVVKPGAEISVHAHRVDDEIYVILQGHGVQVVNDEDAPVGPGDAILLRCGGSHGLRNDADQDLHVLVIDLLAPCQPASATAKEGAVLSDSEGPVLSDSEGKQSPSWLRNLYDAPLTAKRSGGGAGEILVGPLFTAEELGPAWDFVQCLRLPPGSAVGLHTHRRDEEIYYVLEGEGLLTDDGEEVAVGPGYATVCNPGGSHALANTSAQDMVLLIAQAPLA
jgi:mannose-6-phosphate isomerase-like protein (cupin superfamily)